MRSMEKAALGKERARIDDNEDDGDLEMENDTIYMMMIQMLAK